MRCALPRELRGSGVSGFAFDAQLASHVSAEATHHGQVKAGALAIYLAGEEPIDNADHHSSRFRAFQGDANPCAPGLSPASLIGLAASALTEFAEDLQKRINACAQKRGE